VVGKVDLIQSVDSERLLRAIDKEAAKQGIVQNILLEVNIGEEASKSGFGENDILPLMEKVTEFPNICIKGLMAIPPISRNCGENLHFFQKMFQLTVDIKEKIEDNVMVDCLSMGMSGDFEDAVAAGSTMIRVGTAIFGARNYAKDSSK
jgi:pyridoxal phosphate enzyme (YggS family)